MSDAVRIALVGATGLIGRAIISASVGREDIRLVGIARRETPLPRGARMEMFVAEADRWGDVFEAIRPDVLVNALGTTWKKSGQNEDAFRAVDQDLVLSTARRAHAFGTRRVVSISSVGADAFAKSFYLRVKGEVDRDLRAMGFKRLDILRPGLLVGEREGERRPLERAGIVMSPFTNTLLHGSLRRYRAVGAQVVARAALAAARKSAPGKFAYEHDGIQRLAASLPEPV